MDILSGDESDDGSSESSGLLEVARKLVPAAATGRGNILPRGAVRPEYAGGDDKMFYIIDGQWGIVLVKDVMPALKTPARNETTPALAKRKAPVHVPYNRSPCGRMQIIEGQYASIQPGTTEVKFE